MSKKKPSPAEKKLSEYAVTAATTAAQALAAAELLGVKTKPIELLLLDESDRAAVAGLSTLDSKLKKRLSSKKTKLTVADTGLLVMAISEAILDTEPKHQVPLMIVTKKLLDSLAVVLLPQRMVAKMPKSASFALYQFKITLLNINPAIWRRIQVSDCTLDEVHEHIQTAMGWTNSHLHQFEINGKRYGDPELLNEGIEDLDDFRCLDSTKTKLSQILPKTGKSFTFKYDYDFGDGWQHAVVFEGIPPVDPKVKYPLCLEGERACPPEDCGGSRGYGNFLEAIRNPKHEEHESMLEWIGGVFDPEAFDSKQATKLMKKGLPNWR